MHFDLFFASHPQARYLYYLAKLCKSPNVVTLNAADLSKKNLIILYKKKKLRTRIPPIYKDLQTARN